MTIEDREARGYAAYATWLEQDVGRWGHMLDQIWMTDVPNLCAYDWPFLIGFCRAHIEALEAKHGPNALITWQYKLRLEKMIQWRNEGILTKGES